jgi:hypothetical protein
VRYGQLAGQCADDLSLHYTYQSLMGTERDETQKGSETGRVGPSVPWHDCAIKKKEKGHTPAQRDVKDEILWLKKSIYVAITGWVVRNRFP